MEQEKNETIIQQDNNIIQLETVQEIKKENKFKNNIFHKILKYKKMILVGVMSSLLVFVIVFGLLWHYRASIFKIVASNYMEQALVGKGAGNEGSENSTNPFTQESYVVDAVKKTNPAVVSIIISKEVPKYETYYEQQPNPFGDLFGGANPFGGFQFNIPMQRQNGTEKKEIGGGSGFLVTSNGLIVTNKHVVEMKDAEYTVFTNDGKKHVAKVIARDPVLDIAVIKIDGTGYPYLELGDSDSLNIGQSVIAIGNALGEFRNTVSVGVVSGLSRSVVAGDGSGKSELLDHVIQTDAAINPGNSGGPLLNLSGKVVGVNVAVAQGSQSIGFALPVNTIRSVVESVKSTGKIVRPFVGVRYVAINAEIKEKNNLTVDYGILVQRGETKSDLAVIPGSPADKAGIVENDIILEIDGVKIDQDQDFASIIRNKKVGDTIVLKMLHKGVEKTVNVTLESAPEK
jgi:serine protease Do